MKALAAVCEQVSATSKKSEKVRLLADYFAAREVPDAAVSAVFLSGGPFPARDGTTLDVGWALLRRAILSVAGETDEQLFTAYRKHGDLGDAAHDILAPRASAGGKLGVREVEARLRAIAARRGADAKLPLVEALLAESSAIEAKYLVKIITSDLRIGSKESLVEEAIALAYSAPVTAVQRANMLLGDIGAALRLAAEGRLGEAKMQLFHALGPMLASPAESAEEAFSSFEHALVEDKYDGIRAQAHAGRGEVRLFSRTRDDVTAAFPELIPELTAFDGEVILDGEILAFRSGRALSFADLQKRLGRKKVTAALQREIPVAFVAFDVIYAAGELWIDRPLAERAEALDRAFASRHAPIRSKGRGQLALDFGAAPSEPRGTVLRAPTHRADSAAELDALFAAAQARGNEGLMIKDLASPYTPGRRGKSWLKLKRELGTLDVVVTAVEHGHGKRAAVLSDYTFAVRDGDRLVNIGKAYTGLTDVEIAELTAFFIEHTIEDRGRYRVVEPNLVIEVAFNAIMRSDRHESGFALRFPRIVRVRRDKLVTEIDTIARAEQIFQLALGSGFTPAPGLGDPLRSTSGDS